MGFFMVLLGEEGIADELGSPFRLIAGFNRGYPGNIFEFKNELWLLLYLIWSKITKLAGSEIFDNFWYNIFQPFFKKNSSNKLCDINQHNLSFRGKHNTESLQSKHLCKASICLFACFLILQKNFSWRNCWVITIFF